MSVPPPSYIHPGPPPERPERPEGAPDRPGRQGLPPWGWWMGFLGIFGALLLTTAIGLAASVVFVAATGSDSDQLPSGIRVGLTYVQDLIFIGGALLTARLVRWPTPGDFGLVRPPIMRAVALLAGIYVAFYAFSAAWASVLGIDEKEDLPTELGADKSTVALVAVLVLVSVMAPVAEEILFRGLLFTSVRASAGLWPGVLATGVVFGGIHVGSSPVGFLVPLGVFGAALALLYALTGSLYSAIALHAVNNSIAFGVTQSWTWQIPLTLVGAVAASLAIASLVSRALARRRPAPA